jgi:hypothetical protein
MMKIKYICGLALATLFMTSCSEDTMDRINTDEAHPSTSIVAGKYQITDAEVSTVYNILCGNYAWYVSSYTEQLFGTGNNQLKNVEVRQLSEMSASSTFNNEWNNTYANLNNLISLKKKCAVGGVCEGQYDLLGMEQTLEALNWGVLTDLHGDIPCSECLKVSAPKLDSQDSVYNYIFALLDSAQVNFAKGGEHASAQDILFANDLDKWAGLAHALKARYLLHTYGVNKNVLAEVLTETDAAVAKGFDGCNLDVFNGKTADNSWSAYWVSREYIGSSKTVDDLLVERKDPREAIYNYDKFGTKTVAAPGDTALAVQTEGVDIPAWLEKGAAYLHLFSKSELYFIRAEVKARLNQDAKSDFQTGVKAAFADWISTGSPAGVAISDSDIIKYLAKEDTLYASNPLKEIMIQKYIAQTRDEQLETYNDIRRCRYTDGTYYVTMTNPENTVAGANHWPLRLPYGESDVVSNPNVSKAFGTGNAAGTYIFSDPVWWAGGTR